MQEPKKVEVRGRDIFVNFRDEGRAAGEDYSLFPLTKKRNYAKRAEASAEALELLLQSPMFEWGLLSIRYDITLPEDDEGYIGDERLTMLIADLFDDDAIALVRQHVDALYSATGVDIDSGTTKKGTEELQFTNEHAKIILAWSFAATAVIPIITSYLYFRNYNTNEGQDVCVAVFARLLRKFEGDEGRLDLLAKLRKFVESRVLQSRYSNRVIWGVLRTRAADPHTVTESILRKVIVDNIPALNQGRNIVAFFHVCVQRMIDYRFKTPHAISYKPVRVEGVDAESGDSMEHLEGELARRDEGAAVVGENIARQALADVARECGGMPSDAEVEHWIKQFREHGLTQWHRGIVTKFFLRRLGRVEHIRTRTLADFARMFILTRRWLAKTGFTILNDYMGARSVEAVDTKRLNTRRKFLRDFTGSKQYAEILGRHYNQSFQSIIDSDVVINMIGAVYLSHFERLPEFGKAPAGPTIVEHRVESIAQETLRFISRVV